jgi:hypothetical protein
MVRIMSGVSEMKTVRSLIWVAVIVTVLGPGFLRLDGQEVIPADKSDTFRLTVAMEKQTLPIGQPPRVLLTTKNLTDHLIPAPGDRCGSVVRIWVQGEHGEPPTTLRERDATGRLLPGEGTLQCTLVADIPPLGPGESTTRTFLLEAFYDLQAPGKYNVYLEVPSPDGWLRTDTVAFQIVASELPPNKSNL